MKTFVEYCLFKEAMITPDTLQPNEIVKVDKINDDYLKMIVITDQEGKIKAHLRMVRSPIKSYWTVHQEAEQGYGPFLYDVAIEYATKMGSGVIPAVGSMGGWNTEASSNVWKYYFTNRKDVKHSLPNEVKEYLDKCQNSSDPRLEEYCREYKERPWLFQLYQKPPIFIKKLSKMNKIIDSEGQPNVDDQILYAVKQGNLNKVKSLIMNATNVNEALEIAAMRGDYHMVRVLLKKATKFDKALEYARSFRHAEIAAVIQNRINKHK